MPVAGVVSYFCDHAMSAACASCVVCAFSLAGGYNGVEDYRWEVVRRDLITNRIAFELFNLTYISTFQVRRL